MGCTNVPYAIGGDGGHTCTVLLLRGREGGDGGADAGGASIVHNMLLRLQKLVCHGVVDCYCCIIVDECKQVQARELDSIGNCIVFEL
jgi:hypothetical protein